MMVSVHLKGTKVSSSKQVSAMSVEGFHVPVELCDIEEIAVELNDGRVVILTGRHIKIK